MNLATAEFLAKVNKKYRKIAQNTSHTIAWKQLTITKGL